MVKNYLYGTNAIFMVYDITNYASFQHLEDWYRVLQKSSQLRLPRIVLIGNKGEYHCQSK